MSRLPEDALLRLARRGAPPEDPPSTPRQAAVAAVLRGPATALEVLLIRRVEHERDPWSGHIALPGGSREPEDAGLFDTAVRETREEVGLDLAYRARLLCRLEPVAAVAGRRIEPFDITPFVFALSGAPALHLGDEADAAFWMPLDEILSGRLDDTHTWERDGVARRLPCWRWQGHVVWGLTYRMLHGLLGAAGAR